MHTLHHVLENKALEGSGLQGLKNDLVSSLKRRYPAVESNLTVACATLLDPRFKSMPFKDNSILQAVKNKIIEEMKQQSPEETEVQSTAQYRSESHIQPAKKGKGGFWTHYEEAFGQAASTSTLVPTQVSCEDELRYYLQEKTIDPNLANPVGHIWLMSPHLRLQQLALKYLCIPPSTVFSERLFSTAGNICDAKRNRLDPDRVKMLVFLNKNLK